MLTSSRNKFSMISCKVCNLPKSRLLWTHLIDFKTIKMSDGLLHIEDPGPIDWPDILGVTLEDFYLFNNSLVIEERRSHNRISTNVCLEDIIESINRKNLQSFNAAEYLIRVTSSEELNKNFQILETVKEDSIFPTFYPDYDSSCYLRNEQKCFYAYQKGYKSEPRLSYGGLCEWIYVTNGRLDITVCQPTEANMARYWSLDQDEEFIAERDTSECYKLLPGSLFHIPPGLITIREAKKHSTCTYGGKYLGSKLFEQQLISFGRDVENSLHAKRNNSEIDKEIRSLYWYYAAKVLYLISNAKLTESQKELYKQTLILLRGYLQKWNTQYTKFKDDRLVDPSIFAPPGLLLGDLLKSIRDISYRIKRKSVQGNKYPVDVSITQTVADHNSN